MSQLKENVEMLVTLSESKSDIDVHFVPYGKNPEAWCFEKGVTLNDARIVRTVAFASELFGDYGNGNLYVANNVRSCLRNNVEGGPTLMFAVRDLLEELE
jgi:hypothetical protein